MQAYIKTRAAFRTLLARPALSYSLVLDSLDAEPGQVTLLGGDVPESVKGGFLLLGGEVFGIDRVTPGEGSTKLTLCSPVDFFSRRRFYRPPAEGETVGGFAARELAAFRDEADPAYAMPYLDPLSIDETPFLAPEVDDSGLYDLAAYLRTVRASQGVEAVFSARGDRLQILLRRTAPAEHTLVAGDGHTYLVSHSYSRTAVAKVTTLQPVDTGELDADGEKIFRTDERDWYLSLSGAITETIPADRAAGEWVTVTVSEKAEPAEAAAAAVAGNGESHRIELRCDRRLQVRDRVRLRLQTGEVFVSSVSAVSRTLGDGRWLIRLGNMATSLTDKVRASSTSRSSGSSRGAASGENYAVGDIYFTTREGNPAVLLGYGAWEQLQGRFIFAADSSRPAGTRGGSATHTLTADELPEQTLVDPAGLYTALQGAPSGSAQWNVSSYAAGIRTKTVGKGESFDLLPPYIALYAWKRKE